MNYNEMAREYKITANELLKKIENLKIEKKGSYGIQLNELNHRIKMLEEMYVDCDFTARVMKARATKNLKD